MNRRVRMRYDGKDMLRKILLHDAGFASLEAAVAKHSLFLHPDTVRQTENRNLFRMVRDAGKRYQLVEYQHGTGQVLLDDNNGPASAFEWAVPGFSRKDAQLNHLYTDSRNVETYTSMANLCVTPAFLAKLTDTDEAIVTLLQFRAYDLYGFVPQGRSTPEKPEGYAKLEWHPFAPPVTDLEKTFRQRMARNPKRPTTISACKIGWLFSGFEPDPSLPSAD